MGSRQAETLAGPIQNSKDYICFGPLAILGPSWNDLRLNWIQLGASWRPNWGSASLRITGYFPD
eukprot:12171078-Karenia_brevis.AAC.1